MSILFPLISFPYASRILLPNGIGQINFVNSIIDLFLLIASLGIGTYGTREGSKIRDNQELLDKFAREMFVINMISMTVSLLLFAVGLFFIDKFSEVRTLLLITAVKIVFESVSLSWVLAVKEDYKAIALRSVVLQIVSLVFLFMFVHTPADLWKYAVMGILYCVGTNTFSLFYTRHYVNIFRHTKIELKKHFSKMIIFFALAASAKLYAIVDSTMLGFLCAPEQVGYYSAANKLVNIVMTLTSAGLAVFLPRCTYYYSNNQKKEYYALVRTAINTTIFYAVPASLGLFILCEPLILLFNGENYAAAIPSMRLLCLQIIFTTLILAVENLILVPKNRERIILIGQNVSFGVNLILNSILIRKYQAFGASIATCVSQIVLFLILFFNSHKHIIHGKFLVNLFQSVLTSVSMLVIVDLCTDVISNRILQVVLGLFIGAVTYGAFSLLEKNAVALNLLKTAIEKKNRAFHRAKIEYENSLPIEENQNIAHDVIISLTSYPDRLDGIHLVIRSLLHQSLMPEKIILYLGTDTKESDIPKRLRKLEQYNFEIRTGVENLMPHKKYFFAMKEYPDKVLITVDDDAIYDHDLVADLMASYKKYPRCVSARRTNLMTKRPDGTLNKYKNWKWEFTHQLVPSYSLLATGCGGVLYPPHILPEEAFDVEAIKKYSLNTDDIWLKFMELKNGVKVVFTNSDVVHPLPLRFTQESGLLQTNTKGENRNDINIAAMEKFTGIKLANYI